MALTNVATAGQQGMGSTARVQSFARITLDLDASYATGGYTSFASTVKTALDNQNITIVDVKRANAGGGYQYIYNRVTDALMVYRYPTSIGPMVEVGNGVNLSAVTGVELIVYWV